MDRDLAEAERLIDEALAMEPENPNFLDTKGWVLYRRGRLDEALEYLERAAEILPDDPEIGAHVAMLREMVRD